MVRVYMRGMLTDQQALRLLVQNMGILELVDWIQALLRRLEAAPAAAPKTDRREYMRKCMQRRRAEKKRLNES
jgi:hypothetical protein